MRGMGVTRSESEDVEVETCGEDLHLNSDDSLQGRDNALDISYDPLRIIGVMGSLSGFLTFRLGKGTLDGGDRASVVMEGSRSGWTGEDKGRLRHVAREMAV
jgi:hypothetical protein